MSETICPCCGASSPNEAVYCMRCGEPIKCKNCGAGILANARACIQCGKLIPERESRESQYVGAGIVPPGYNRLTVRQRAESYEYSADFVFSNDIGQQTGTGEFISHLSGFGERSAPSRPIPQQAAQESNIVEVNGQHPTVPQLTSAAAGLASTSAGAPSLQNDLVSQEERAIRTVFSEREGKLTLQMSDLKAATQTDYTLRLAHIFMYARKVLFGEEETPRAEVFSVAKFANLPHDNVVAYLSRDTSIDRKGSSDILSLNLPGLEHARKCLKEIMDPAVPPGKWTPPSEARVAPRLRKSGKRGESRVGEDQMAVLVGHPETQALVSDIPHNTIADMTTLDKVTVALYGLNKAGQEEEVYYSTIEDYLYNAFQVTVEADTIGHALRRAIENHNKNVVHKEGAGYRITPSGSDYIEATYRNKSRTTPKLEEQPERTEQPESKES